MERGHAYVATNGDVMYAVASFEGYGRLSGKRLEDLRVRSSVGGRNFANRFICRAGRQAFTHHFLRLAGRYLQLHIIDPGDSFTLHYAGLLPTPAELVVAAILGAIFLCSLAVPAATPRPAGRDGGSFGATLRRPEVRALFGACLLMSAAHGALYVFYSIHVVELGYAKAFVGWLWTLGVVAEIAVFALMPRLMRRYGARDILLISFACAVLRFLLIGWGAENLGLLLFAQLLHGATFGAYHAAAIAVVNRWFPGRLQSHGQALYGSLSFGAGGMIGGLISGYTWDTIGPAWTYTLGSAFALAGLAANLVAFFIRGGAKMLGLEHAGARPLSEWLLQASASYAVCGLLAGLASGAIWFQATRPRKQREASG